MNDTSRAAKLPLTTKTCAVFTLHHAPDRRRGEVLAKLFGVYPDYESAREAVRDLPLSAYAIMEQYAVEVRGFPVEGKPGEVESMWTTGIRSNPLGM